MISQPNYVIPSTDKIHQTNKKPWKIKVYQSSVFKNIKPKPADNSDTEGATNHGLSGLFIRAVFRVVLQV